MPKRKNVPENVEFFAHCKSIRLHSPCARSELTCRRFTSERLSQGRKVLKGGYAPEAMQYAKRGVPDSMRPGVWRVILGLPKARVGGTGACTTSASRSHLFCFRTAASARALLLCFQRSRFKMPFLHRVFLLTCCRWCCVCLIHARPDASLN